MKRKALQQGCSSKNTETHARELLGAPLSTGFQANAQPDGPQVGLLRASNQPTSTAWLPHRCFHGFICLLQHCVHCLAASQVLSWLHLPPATLRHMPEQHCALLGCLTGVFVASFASCNTETHARASRLERIHVPAWHRTCGCISVLRFQE